MTRIAERFATGIARATGVVVGLVNPVPCRFFQYLEVIVTDSVTLAGIGHAHVTCAPGAGPPRTRTTDGHGRVRFNVAPGNYNVTVRADWYLPEPSPAVGIAVVAGHNAHLPIALDHLYFHLHVDGDRDGTVDAQPEVINGPTPPWRWGHGRRGAIIPCNNNDDDHGLANANTGNLDNTDAVVNRGNDAANLVARLEVRRHGCLLLPPAAWVATLSVPAGSEQNIRIFDTPLPGGAQIIGPLTGAVAAATVHNIGALSVPGGGGGMVTPPGALGYGGNRFGMEAVRYAGLGFDGRVQITLVVTKPPASGLGPNVSLQTSAEVRVAPWLMPSHMEEAHTVYVADLGADVVNGAGVLTAGNAAFRVALAGSIGVLPLVQHPVPGAQDRWMQDTMEIGYSNWPGSAGAGHRWDVVMKAFRAKSLAPYSRSLLSDLIGFQDSNPGGASNTFDSTGNLKVTPPVRARSRATGGAKHYPLGRIYYGAGRGLEVFNAAVLAFLEAQEVQRPIPLDTGWLKVGHVDEMMSFVPAPPTPPPFAHGVVPSSKDWRLLIACPRRAYAIMDALPPVTPMLVGRQMDDSFGMLGMGFIPIQTTVGAMTSRAAPPALVPADLPNLFDPLHDAALNTAVDGGMALNLALYSLTAAALRTWNLMFVQPRLTAVLRQLRDEIDLDLAADVIEVPVVFKPEDTRNVAGGLTGDMVNMLVVNNHCVIPQAFGPVVGGTDQFQAYLTAELARVNVALVPHYVDDWYAYHTQLGEIHCGTNTLRRPANVPAWLGTQAAEWWRFTG